MSESTAEPQPYDRPIFAECLCGHLVPIRDRPDPLFDPCPVCLTNEDDAHDCPLEES